MVHLRVVEYGAEALEMIADLQEKYAAEKHTLEDVQNVRKFSLALDEKEASSLE